MRSYPCSVDTHIARNDVPLGLPDGERVAQKVASVTDGYQAVVAQQHATRARSEAAPTTPTAPTPISAEIGQAFEWFSQLPVVIVLMVLWVVVAVLLGSCALVLYVAGSVLVRSLAGSL